MPAIFCNGKFYSGQKGDQGVGIDNIVQNSDSSLSIFLSTGREIRTRPIVINGTILPVIDISTDTGKIPVIGENGEWYYDDYPSGVLPVVSEEDSGKILRVDEDGNWSVVDYTTVSGLPNITTADEGKILTVDSNGNWVIVEKPPESAELIAFDLEGGYVNGNNWTVGGDTGNYSDVYIVFAGRTYMIRLDSIVGTRFRAIFTMRSVIGATSNVTDGVSIANEEDPLPYAMASYTPESNGYIVITKDNEGTSGIITKCLVTS